jgi:signal peptidase II
MKNFRDILISAVFFIFLLLTDQAAKYMIRSSGGFHVCNENLAFGLQLDSLLFYILWTFIIFTIIHLLAKKAYNWNLRIISYIFILAGALGNMLDRFFYGCVVDFINLKFWPIFNLADVFITAGVILLITQKLNIKNRNDNVK